MGQRSRTPDPLPDAASPSGSSAKSPPSATDFVLAPLPPFGWRDLAFAGILIAAVLLLFGRAATFEEVNLDDPQYIRLHDHVSGGPTLENLRWGLTTFYYANWHPLTWWSWQLDVALWGAGPAGHHGTNIALHLVNTLLCWQLLRRLTGRPAESFVVALLFAIHPLRWESVAWISERKDLLSATFALLALDRYDAYARRPGLGRMVIVAVCLALSLMAKAMAVTLPCVMLLLDWRPYRRWASFRAVLGLIREKWLLWILVAGTCVLTFLAQREGGAVRNLEELSFSARVTGALWAYVIYIGQTLWPTRLSVFYPIPAPRPLWQPIVAILLLVCLTGGAIALRRRWPAVLVGWLCYLGMLVPVIGLVQVGGQAHADRYTYLPSIPLVVALGAVLWGFLGHRLTRPVQGVLFAAVVIPLAVLSVRQGSTWQNSRVLWQQATRVAPGDFNWWNLAMLELNEGRYAEAVPAFREACRYDPEAAESRGGLAAALDGAEQWDEAGEVARETLAMSTPDLIETRARCRLILGKGEAHRGDLAAARKEFAEGLALSESVLLRSELAVRLLRAGGAADALPHLQKLRDEQPGSPAVHGNLANAHVALGDWNAAAGEFAAALELAPDDHRMRSRYATALLASGDRIGAQREARAVVRRDPRWPPAAFIGAHAMVYAPQASPAQLQEGIWLARTIALLFEGASPQILDVEARGAAGLGRFEEAARLADEAIRAAQERQQTKDATEMEARRDAYRSGRIPEK